MQCPGDVWVLDVLDPDVPGLQHDLDLPLHSLRI